MTKHIFIVGALLFTFASCTKDDIKEDLLSISYNKFEFKNFYDLVKNPISIDLLKRRLDAQKITYESSGGYEKDIFFIVSDTNLVYKNYRIEVEAGDVLINFDNPTSKDVRRDYVQNVIIYPLDDDKNIIKESQPKEKYKGVFDLVKNSLEEIDSEYDTTLRIVSTSIFGGGFKKNYETFINDMENDDGIAIWDKTIKDDIGYSVELTLENISKEYSAPKIQIDYRASFFSRQEALHHDSRYRIQIMAVLPKDVKQILF